MNYKFFFLFFVGLLMTAGCNYPRPETFEPAIPTQLPAIGTVHAVGNPFGIEGYGVDDLQLINQTGAVWFRRNGLLWSEVEPQPGVRDWENVASLEAELRYASSEGLQVILVVRSTPSWAQTTAGSFCGPPNQQSLPYFADFLHVAVKRYSVPPYNVKYWEIGNEPDVDPALVSPKSGYGCWGKPDEPGYGGGYYAGMLKQVYPQIKSADPQAQVLVGGLLLDCDPLNPPEKSPGSGELRDCSSSTFLEGILQNEGGNYLDGVSFHAYDYYGAPENFSNSNWHSSSQTTGPALIAKAHFLRSLLEQYGYKDKFLSNTEVALLCGRTGDEPICQTEEFAKTKSAYLIKVYAAAMVEGLRSNIWFSLRGSRGVELADKSFEPKPTYQAYQFLVGQLKGVNQWQEVKVTGEVKGYEFSGGGQRIWLLWSMDENSHSVNLPQAPQAVYDLQGNSLQVSDSLSVGSAPVYVVWKSTGSAFSAVALLKSGKDPDYLHNERGRGSYR